ncbi:MAG: macro domain-containing protein, partial [Bacilli bacterium]|nr:macro domain-containing protein [Bacilli bacterium]
MRRFFSIDITNFRGDAIINSLGYGRIRQPGLLFASILDKCSSIRKLVSEAEQLSQGKEIADCFMTRSYCAGPFDYIIHVLTPFRHGRPGAGPDDSDLSLLKKAYWNALELARARGLKSVCLPSIGNGANGYSNEESFDALTEVTAEYANEHPEMDIYVDVLYVEQTRGPVAEFECAAEEALVDDELPGRLKRLLQEFRDFEKRSRQDTSALGRLDIHDLPMERVQQRLLDWGVTKTDSLTQVINKYIKTKAASNDKKETFGDPIKEAWLKIGKWLDQSLKHHNEIGIYGTAKGRSIVEKAQYRWD